MESALKFMKDSVEQHSILEMLLNESIYRKEWDDHRDTPFKRKHIQTDRDLLKLQFVRG